MLSTNSYNRPIVRADKEVINWMVGRRMKLPVHFWKSSDASFPQVRCCLTITKGQGDDQKKYIRAFEPKDDWRIAGHIMEMTGMHIVRKESNVVGSNPETIVKYKDKDGNEKEEHSSWDAKGAICRAFILHIGEEEADKLLDEAEKERDKFKYGKEDGK